jgi:hypothetical protein
MLRRLEQRFNEEHAIAGRPRAVRTQANEDATIAAVE